MPLHATPRRSLSRNPLSRNPLFRNPLSRNLLSRRAVPSTSSAGTADPRAGRGRRPRVGPIGRRLLPARARGAALAAALVTLPLLQPAPAAAASFRLVLEDNFNGTKINHSTWGVYAGGEGGDRVASNTIVRDGKLILRTQKVKGVWKGAGVSAARGNMQTYGKYEMRVRFDRGYGVRGVGLLWPAGDGWPPEVDFYEVPGGGRQFNTLTNHYRTPTSKHKMQHDGYHGDFASWQTVSVEWTPDRLLFKLNGVTQVTMTKNVPRARMWLGLQTRPGSDSGIRPSSETPPVVDMEVDWVKIYSWS